MRAIVKILALCAMCLFFQRATAQDGKGPLRPVQSAYMLMCGRSHLADTYLSPIKYNGVGTGFLYRRSQAMAFDPERWTMQLSIGVNADFVENQAKNTTMYAGEVNAAWGMLRCWKLPANFTVGVGGATSLNLGLLYLQRNSNNPVAARTSWTIDALGYAAWRHTFRRQPVTFSYQASLPTLGAFFAPDYGQLYYQIYLGDRSGLAHCAWWGQYFRLDNLLCADLHLGSTSLRLGYRCDIFSSKANHIVSQRFAHMFVLGIVTDWISLPSGSKKIKADKICNPL